MLLAIVSGVATAFLNLAGSLIVYVAFTVPALVAFGRLELLKHRQNMHTYAEILRFLDEEKTDATVPANKSVGQMLMPFLVGVGLVAIAIGLFLVSYHISLNLR